MTFIKTSRPSWPHLIALALIIAMIALLPSQQSHKPVYVILEIGGMPRALLRVTQPALITEGMTGQPLLHPQTGLFLDPEKQKVMTVRTANLSQPVTALALDEDGVVLSVASLDPGDPVFHTSMTRYLVLLPALDEAPESSARLRLVGAPGAWQIAEWRPW